MFGVGAFLEWLPYILAQNFWVRFIKTKLIQVMRNHFSPNQMLYSWLKILWSEHLDVYVCVHWTHGSNRKWQSELDSVAANAIRHKHKLCKNFKFTSNCSHWSVICPCLKRQSILVKLCKRGMKRAIIISPFVHFLLWLPLWANFCCYLAHTNLHSNPSSDNPCTRSHITC